MADWVNTVFSAEVLAIAIPAIVFAITIVLVVKRLASFVMTLLFLTFALASGLAIVNHDVVRDYVRGEYSNEQVQSWKDEVSTDLQKLWESLKDLKDELIQQEEEETPDAAWVDDVEDRIENLEELIAETRAIVDQRPSRDSESVAAPLPVETETQVTR